MMDATLLKPKKLTSEWSLINSMRVCMILEGCYPYVRGGVSTWVHQYIENSPEYEFALWTIHATNEDARESLYVFPPNVKEHHKIILNENPEGKTHIARNSDVFNKATSIIYELLKGDQSNNALNDLTSLLRCNHITMNLLNSEEFLSLAQRLSNEITGLGMADAYYCLQSMMLPIIKVLSSNIPEADIYHSAVTGYGGLLGALAAIETNKPFILTEHGIYPREREEELIASDWTVPAVRPLWIRLFYEMSKFAYQHATRVTSLFENAKDRQVIIGCKPDKCLVIPNGILSEPFDHITLPEARGETHIGAFVRFAAIKDLRTMIRAFYTAKQQSSNMILHIMGGTDDEDYRASCEALIDRLDLRSNVIIEGHIDTIEYMKKMDFTLLTSISEGQPLTILESMAAGRPCIATRVGDCAGLIEGSMNDIGPAGICCTPMIPEEISAAILRLHSDYSLRVKMGENGKKRVKSKYLLKDMLRAYHAVYQVEVS